MGKLKVFALVVALWRRAKVLRGALDSNTTKEQWYVVIPVTLLVALVGFFLPEVADSKIAVGIVSAIIGVVGPLGSRYVGDRVKEPPLAEPVNPFFYKVKRHSDKSWKDFLGTRYDAILAGYTLGVDDEDNVWDIATCKIIGKHQRRAGTDEQSIGRIKQAVEHLRDSADE